MKDVLDAIIYFEELTEDQQLALKETISSDPELLRIFDRWQQLKGEIRSSLDESVPDREHLVLYALQQSKDTYLTPEELLALEASSTEIRNALHKHPSLHLVVDDIKLAQADFLKLWPNAVETEQSPSETAKIFKLPTYGIFSNRLARIAAVFLVATISFYSVFTLWQNQRIETIRIADDSFRTVYFDDGSKVRLVGASELSYAKSGLLSSFDREVKLAGQAFFDISPNEKPFTVESATALTQATGTQFSIEAQPNQTEVVLTHGAVTLQSKLVEGTSVTLSPGERSRVLSNQAPSLPEQITDMTEQLSWTGLFIFHYSPLTAVASYLGSHYETQIDIAESLQQEQFNASFDPDTLSLDEVFETLTTAFDARIDTVRGESDTYLLSPSLGE